MLSTFLRSSRRGRRMAVTVMAAAAAYAAGCPPPAGAAAPMVRTAAPGYYRILLGGFEITALCDGTGGMPVDHLINTGSRLILIDAGAGALLGPTMGRLTASLKDAGYGVDQVDEIYLTHMHPDHAGGLAADGRRVFPNAIVRADRREAEAWLDGERLAAAPAAAKPYFLGAMSSLNPYMKAGRFRPFEADGELVPGVRSLATHGHTPGHNIYVVESDGQKLVIWGDLVHVAAVQFGDPSVTILYDSDSRAAARQRRKVLANAAEAGYLAAGAHLPFPGLGHVRREGRGYVWVPVNYTVIH